MRLLVLDGSRVVGHLVRRFVPDDVDVKCVDSFDLVIDELLHHAPDAVIVDVTPAALPWHRVQEICHQHKPPIPVLWESCTCTDPVEAGIGDLNGNSAFLAKPYHASQLQEHIFQLMEADHPHYQTRGFHSGVYTEALETLRGE